MANRKRLKVRAGVRHVYKPEGSGEVVSETCFQGKILYKFQYDGGLTELLWSTGLESIQNGEIQLTLFPSDGGAGPGQIGHGV